MPYTPAPVAVSPSPRRTFMGAAVVLAVFLVSCAVGWVWLDESARSEASTSAIGAFLALVLIGWAAVPMVVTTLAVGLHRVVPRAAWFMVLGSLYWLGAGILVVAWLFGGTGA